MRSPRGGPRKERIAHVLVFHRHPWARTYLRTSRCPFLAAFLRVSPSQWYPLACAHYRTSRCPFSAATVHVSFFQGCPLARAHCSTARCPPSAA